MKFQKLGGQSTDVAMDSMGIRRVFWEMAEDGRVFPLKIPDNFNTAEVRRLGHLLVLLDLKL